MPGVDFLTTCRQPMFGRAYVPFRSIYSRNIPNLMMAGRCFSCTHVGLGSPRVMNTLSQMGVAAGYAAAIAKREGIEPRAIYERGFVKEIQRKMGGDWPGNPDPAHLNWKIVDDEDEAMVTFGEGWWKGHMHNGEQYGQFVHHGNRKSGKAVYELPVEKEGKYRLHLRVPFEPWPREKMRGDVVYRVKTAAGESKVKYPIHVGQGLWHVLGEFDLAPGATLEILPGESTNDMIFADAFAVEPVR